MTGVRSPWKFGHTRSGVEGSVGYSNNLQAIGVTDNQRLVRARDRLLLWARRSVGEGNLEEVAKKRNDFNRFGLSRGKPPHYQFK